MKPDLSPVWPWKLLEPFLERSDTTGKALLAATGLLVLLLPLLLWKRPWGWSRRRVLAGAGALLVILLGWLAVRSADPAMLALGALIVIPLALIALTLWAYVGVENTSPRQVLGLLCLRLTAFALLALAILRPSFAFGDRSQDRSTLVILVDRSTSMRDVKDHGKDQSRWTALVKILEESSPELRQLVSDGKVDVVFRAFGADVVDFDPAQPLPPSEPRTDIGAALHRIHEEFSGRKLRGVLLLTDGADTGGIYSTLDEARRFRLLSAPVSAFAFGNPNTPNNLRSVAVVSAVAAPSPVMSKGEFTVRAVLDAPGFVGRKVRVTVLMDGTELHARDVEIDAAHNNEVEFKCTAPPKPGEVEITVKADAPGQVSTARNELTTFLTVSKEGVSVLLIDKKRQGEPQKICDALADRRIRVHTAWVPLGANASDLLQFDRQPYDVIIIGDVTANEIEEAYPKALEKIEKLVGERGTGFIMIGGYSSFAPAIWRNTPIAKLLPVNLDAEGQVEKEAKMTPTDDGLRRFGFVLRQAEREADTKQAWSGLAKLEGFNHLGSLKPLATVLATADGDPKQPLLVAMNYGGGSGANAGQAGRVLAFAGDTTHRWIQSPETAALHQRFWKQTILWLARQEEAETSLWVRPDARRLPVRGKMGFSLGLRKGDFDIPSAEFAVKLHMPDGKTVPLTTTAERDGAHGTIDADRTTQPGLYRIAATGSGKDPEGKRIDGSRDVKFFVFDDDLEATQQAADHAFLKKLANAGNGEFHESKELPAFLRELRSQMHAETKGLERHWPDWRATGRSPFLAFFYLAFVSVLMAEWLLRRKWGMV